MIEPGAVHLPELVEDLASFRVGSDTVFDLTATKHLTRDGIISLHREARKRPVTLIIPPGRLLDRLQTIFWARLKLGTPDHWTLSL